MNYTKEEPKNTLRKLKIFRFGLGALTRALSTGIMLSAQKSVHIHMWIVKVSIMKIMYT